MATKIVRRTVEFRLYPTKAQEATLTEWLRRCCWLYNQALEYRKKAYDRRGESMWYTRQCEWLTGLRSRIPTLARVPTIFARDALRRLDRGFKAFFHRCKAGKKKVGYPRFRPHQRYNSLECLDSSTHLRANGLRVPLLGVVRFRAGNQDLSGKQKLFRVIRRASGWYGQVLVEREIAVPKPHTGEAVGIDMGLTSFATLSTGEKINNPRWARRSQVALRKAQKRVARRVKGSANRRKAVRKLARQHERIAAQRRDFAHQLSHSLVTRFALIGFELLNIKGLARTRMARSIADAAWRMFFRFLPYKAEEAGGQAIGVNPRGTSQECPFCGRVQKKFLFERIHQCPCGASPIDRDEAAALVIRARAVGVAAANACGGQATTAGPQPPRAGPLKQAVRQNASHS